MKRRVKKTDDSMSAGGMYNINPSYVKQETDRKAEIEYSSKKAQLDDRFPSEATFADDTIKSLSDRLTKPEMVIY